MPEQRSETRRSATSTYGTPSKKQGKRNHHSHCPRLCRRRERPTSPLFRSRGLLTARVTSSCCPFSLSTTARRTPAGS
nr:hypothetical protein Iba_chr08cCG9120 [Ipomoea batatas]